ncbi:hypothetical protein [Herbidospora daliensis]|uniref:hypothetical protein n=1 Tax=Herbidospora daliensis TaxID=295585 RepID=UPI0007823D73|nr:hypothetical protein [Herbidospora daliensis]
MRITRSLISAAFALLVGVALSLTTAPAAQAGCSSAVSGSYNWDGTISTHVRGTSCSTRSAHLTVSGNENCCTPFWVKIERQLWGSYGWLTTNTQVKSALWNGYVELNTATVPSRPSDGSERFHACWGVGSSQPSSWDCGPWVS